MLPSPQKASGGLWRKWQFPSKFMEKAIPFLEVMAFASRNHILPFVAAPSASRNNMVNGVRMTLAVGTTMSIAEQNSSPREGRC